MSLFILQNNIYFLHIFRFQISPSLVIDKHTSHYFDLLMKLFFNFKNFYTKKHARWKMSKRKQWLNEWKSDFALDFLFQKQKADSLEENPKHIFPFHKVIHPTSFFPSNFFLLQNKNQWRKFVSQYRHYAGILTNYFLILRAHLIDTSNLETTKHDTENSLKYNFNIVRKK